MSAVLTIRKESKMKTKHVDMLSGSITKGLISLAIPIMIMNVMQVLSNALDMTVLRWFADDRAVGAVGTCSSLITLCTSLLIGISVGANVIVAKRVGAGDKERADRAASTSIIIAILGGLLIMAIGVIFAEPFLKIANCPDTILPQAVAYFRIYFLGVPILMIYNFSASILRSIGDTKRPMYFLILGGFIKTLFTLLFAAVFDMDVKGVGVATVIGNGIACALAFVTLLKKQTVISVNLRKLRFDIKEMKEIIHVGIPAGLQSAMYSVANVIIMSVVNSFGEYATTGISIANQFDNILYHVCYAPSLAVTPYVAQNIGNGNIKRVKKAIVSGILITICFGATLGSLSAIFSRQLASIMTQTPEVIAFARQKIIIVSSTYFICGINEIMGGTMRGLGRPIIPAVSTFLFMCAFRFFWIYVIYPFCPNLTFLYTVWPVGWILSILTILIFYFPTIKKLQKNLA